MCINETDLSKSYFIKEINELKKEIYDIKNMLLNLNGQLGPCHGYGPFDAGLLCWTPNEEERKQLRKTWLTDAKGSENIEKH